MSTIIFHLQGNDESRAEHHDPMVAMLCPQPRTGHLDHLYHNQHLTTSGEWISDLDHTATCRTDKVEIMEYCKKVL